MFHCEASLVEDVDDVADVRRLFLHVELYNVGKKRRIQEDVHDRGKNRNKMMRSGRYRVFFLIARTI